MSAPDLPRGTIVGGDFRIVEPLARGGMGVVYVAEQESTRKRRALKVMLPQEGDLDTLRRRFEQEAHVASQIESDHVVEVIAAGVDPATTMPWIAMELLEGEDLENHLVTRGSLDLTDTWNIVGELCHALEAAHALGLVHRDLKPSNVFLAKSRRPGIDRVVKVLDFGIAKRMSDAGKTTGALGTPLYMSPEQTVAGSTFSPATDVWALGLLVFEMLVGMPYWKSASQEGQIASLIRELVIDPLVPASRRAQSFGKDGLLPNGFDAWFARCVVRDPKARFRDAGDAYRALAKCFAQVTGRDERVIPPASTRMPSASASSPGSRAGEPEPGAIPREALQAKTQPSFEKNTSPVPARSRTGVLVAGIATGVAVVTVSLVVVFASGAVGRRPGSVAESAAPAREPAAPPLPDPSATAPTAPDVVPSTAVAEAAPSPSASASAPPAASSGRGAPSSLAPTGSAVPQPASAAAPPPAVPAPRPQTPPAPKPDPVIL